MGVCQNLSFDTPPSIALGSKLINILIEEE